MAKYPPAKACEPRFTAWLNETARRISPLYRYHEHHATRSKPRLEVLTGMATEIGVSVNTLRAWLSGEAAPELRHVLLIARWAGVPVDTILLLFMDEGWARTLVYETVKTMQQSRLAPSPTFENILAELRFLSLRTLRVELACALGEGTLGRNVPLEQGVYEVDEEP